MNPPWQAAWPYPPRFREVAGSYFHYVDEGAGEPVVFLHGNPTWSYMWRHIIPWVAPTHRCIAVDLIGMGRSGKPSIDYTFSDHAAYLEEFFEQLGVHDVTLVLHDWGGALGVDWARRHTAEVAGVALIADEPLQAVLAPVDSWDDLDEVSREVFSSYRDPEIGWQLVVEENDFIEQTLRFGANTGLTDEEMAYYRAPFLDPADRRMIQRWNQQVPIAGEPAENVDVITLGGQWWNDDNVPKLLLHSTGAGGEGTWASGCAARIPGLRAVDIGNVGHYAPEDAPREIGMALASWLREK